jgi:hypothetical protein
MPGMNCSLFMVTPPLSTSARSAEAWGHGGGGLV